MLVIWNERASPLRARFGAESGVTSSPPKTMRPESGRRLPASWLMKVVLPAPFGPMMACVSPSRTSKSMPSVALSAPKFFTSRRTSSMRLAYDAGETALEEDDRQDEQRSEDHWPVLRIALEELLDQNQRKGAEHRAGRTGDAAEDHHEHEIAGLHPAHEPRGDVVRMVRVKRAGEAADCAGDREGDQPKRVGREADGARARFIRLCRTQDHAEARLDNPMDEVEHDQHEREAQVVELYGVAEVDEAELAAGLEPHAIVAAEDVERDAEVIEHLREGEGDHDEVDSARADRHGADRERHDGGCADRDQPLQISIRDAVEGEDAHRVGADAEIRGMAEGHQSAIAEDQVQARRGDGEDHDPPHEIDIERLADRIHGRWQRCQDHNDRCPENEAAFHRL